MNACAMKASSYLVAYARIPVSENLTLAREDGGKRLRAFPASTSIPPAPVTETTTPFGPPLSNHLARLLSTERSVKILSRWDPWVGPNARNATMSLHLYCQFAGAALALAR